MVIVGHSPRPGVVAFPFQMTELHGVFLMGVILTNALYINGGDPNYLLSGMILQVQGPKDLVGMSELRSGKGSGFLGSGYKGYYP